MKTTEIIKQSLIVTGKSWRRFFRRLSCIHDWEITDLNPQYYNPYPNGKFNKDGIPNKPEGPPCIITVTGYFDAMQLDCLKCNKRSYVERKHIAKLYSTNPGYQPVIKTLNPATPPQGGSGMPRL